jgi:hypothetical protein
MILYRVLFYFKRVIVLQIKQQSDEFSVRENF